MIDPGQLTKTRLSSMSWLTGLVEREKSEHQDYRCAVVAICGDIKMKIVFTGVNLLYVSTVGVALAWPGWAEPIGMCLTQFTLKVLLSGLDAGTQRRGS